MATYYQNALNQSATIPSATVYDLKTHSRRMRLAYNYGCPTLPPNFKQNGDDLWGCVDCEDESVRTFCQPFLRTDKFWVQFQFEDTIESNLHITLANGWRTSSAQATGTYFVRAYLADENCDPIPGFEDVPSFSDMFCTSASSRYRFIQSFRLDISKIGGLSSFKIIVETFNEFGTLTGQFISEPYCLAGQHTKCLETVLITGTYLGYDCLSRDYTNKSCPFEANVRVPGSLKKISINTDLEKTDSGHVVGRTVKETYEIMGGFYPPYFAELVSAALMADTAYIDGLLVDAADEIRIIDDTLKLFNGNIRFETVCEENAFVC